MQSTCHNITWKFPPGFYEFLFMTARYIRTGHGMKKKLEQCEFLLAEEFKQGLMGVIRFDIQVRENPQTFVTMEPGACLFFCFSLFFYLE